MEIYKTISQIDSIISRINTHTEYSQCLARDEYGALRSEAEKHSLEMELQFEDIPMSRAGDVIQARDKHRTKATKRLNEAEEYLLKNGINLPTLYVLGYKIAPINNKREGFRNEIVSFGPFYGEEPEKIVYRMKSLVDFLESFSVHPVLRASNAHLETVLIHPYMDGNGRAGRLLQNYLLFERNYPPAIIKSDEKKKYLEMIGRALKDRINGKSGFHKMSDGEEEFHSFVASGVLESAKKVEETLKSKRMYDVHLRNVGDAGAVRVVANVLRAYGRIGNEGGIVVSIDKGNGVKKGENLRVTGNISTEELKNKLTEFAQKYGFRFSVEPNPKGYC